VGSALLVGFFLLGVSSRVVAAPQALSSGSYTVIDRSLRVSHADRFAVDGNDLLLFNRVTVEPRPTPAPDSGAAPRASSDSATPGGFAATRMPIAQCLIVLRDQPGATAPGGAASGVLIFSDGQRFPGEPAPAGQRRRIRPEVDQRDAMPIEGRAAAQEVADAADATNAASAAAPAEPAADAEPSLVWRHRWLGDIPLEMDRLRSIIIDPLASADMGSSFHTPIGSRRPLKPDRERATAIATDQILLVNGDRLDGIVTELDLTVRLERDLAAPAASPSSSSTPPPSPTDAAQAGGSIGIPIDRIAAMSFITPELPVEGPRVWCSDGTVLRAIPRIDVDTGLIVMDRVGAATGGAVGAVGDFDRPSIRPQEVLGFAPDASRVLPLAAFAPVAVDHAGETPRVAVAWPERLGGVWSGGAAPIVVRGPARVAFEMPMEGCTIVAELRIFDPDPAWTDCEVILRDGDRELLRRRMIASSEPIPVVLPLATTNWSIEISEGELGPIRDAVEIRRAVVILPER
jgi:hypothetical protein